MDYPSDIAFSKSVKEIQVRKKSRDIYARMERSCKWQTKITSDLATFIAEQKSFFLATVNSDGQPYIQHRGGPAGFLKVIDNNTLSFADFKGNRQFITQGNLIDNPKAFLFLIDYSNAIRIKIWGTARIIEDQPELLAALAPHPDEYKAVPEQILQFTVVAWDRNCPQHIPILAEQEDVEKLLLDKERRIEELETQLLLQSEG